MKISLVHNPTAGGGQDLDDIIGLVTGAGHTVRHRSTKGRWKVLLQDPGDLLVAAGGDGTVRKVALAAADTAVPFAILPIGTANNIAKTLSLMGDARALVESWSDGLAQGVPFDIGQANGNRFVESIGGGPIADLIARSDEIEAGANLLGRETDRALYLFRELVADAPTRPWRVLVDGSDVSGDYLAVEIVNIRFVGSNVPVAPAADPSDGLLDVVLIGEAERQSLIDYLDGRLQLSSGTAPETPRVTGRMIELEAPAGVRMHLDDRLWPKADSLKKPKRVDIRCLSGAATLVGPGPPSVDGVG
ncbi:MAG: diacylglycerol kinase [Propionibacteriaceae bacterium]|jgi:diacylglycerol kinase family enzyme|nr:diacylglycerol kinase [Propionibacteriaceae bacterium]